jgi:uncharacterized protein (DUF885 family)
VPFCLVLALAVVALLPGTIRAQTDTQAVTGRIGGILLETSELRDMVSLYSADRSALMRRWNVAYSPTRRARLESFYNDWRSRLSSLEFDGLSQEGRIDYILLDLALRRELEELEREARLAADMATLVPFAGVIAEFEERRRRHEPVQPQESAAALADLASQVDSLVARIRDLSVDEVSRADRIIGLRAIGFLDRLQRTLGNWHEFYSGYDPTFSWWAAEPYRRTTTAIGQYTRAIREEIVGQREGEEEPIIGDPIGRDALLAALQGEMIAYTPEELIAFAEQEFRWIDAEKQKAAREMGFDDDTAGVAAALEKVKRAYVAPGEQPELVRRLAHEAIEFVRARDLVTVHPLAEEIWRMEMLSPEQQLVSPFFLGGEVIRVAYPTDSMAHADKLMSMRGNNPYFSKATVHHELIPGHHLQGFMASRYNAHRGVFSTPFWTEGWALYWEMLLWDEGFAQVPEERMGMLFWRSHRLARIIFSLKFHLGEMTPDEAIDLLVDRVGHERANAEAEVRRSFNGSYPPLYQAAYMLGGMQIRALHEELVGGGRMTNRDFHDAILQGGRMPIEMVRARVTGEPLARDYRANWKFFQ